MPSRLRQRPPPFSKLLRNHFRDLLKGDPLSPRPALAHSAPQRSRLGVTGHFKMHHLGSNQSAPPLRRGFCRLVGLVGQAAVLGWRWAGLLGGSLHLSPPEEGFGETWFPIQTDARSACFYFCSVVSVLAFLLPRSAALSCRR